MESPGCRRILLRALDYGVPPSIIYGILDALSMRSKVQLAELIYEYARAVYALLDAGEIGRGEADFLLEAVEKCKV